MNSTFQSTISLIPGTPYQITAMSTMGLSVTAGTFHSYTQAGLPLFMTNSMGLVICDPALGWNFSPLLNPPSIAATL